MSRKNILSSFALLLLFGQSIYAETTTKVFAIPLGQVRKIHTAQDIKKLINESGEKKAAIVFTEDDKDKYVDYGSVKFYLKDKKNYKKNYNSFLEIAKEMAKHIDDLDYNVVSKTLDRIKVR